MVGCLGLAKPKQVRLLFHIFSAPKAKSNRTRPQGELPTCGLKLAGIGTQCLQQFRDSGQFFTAHLKPGKGCRENVDGYPLVNIQKAIEKWPVEIVDLPIFTYIKVVIFHIVM